MDELFEKLIEDKLSPEELRELRTRFNAATDEELAHLFNGRDPEDADAGPVSRDIINETKEEIDRTLFSDYQKKRNRWRIPAIAAAIAVPLLVVGAIWWFIDNPNHAGNTLCTVTTGANETSSLMLSDGTSVKINGNSVFSFPSGFRNDHREVSFRGEAYFQIAKNAEAPFIITTPAMTVYVKGTAFNLTSRQGARYSELSLDNGSVTVRAINSEESIDMQPETKIILDNATGEITVKPIDYHQGSSSWTSQELHFENATPEFLIDRIEQNYQISLDANLKESIDENFTGTLPADNLDDALGILRRLYSR